MSANAVLRRKLESGKRFVPVHETDTAERGWRLALARAAQDVLGLALEVGPVRESRRKLAELMELPPENALMAILEGPEGGLGLIVIGPEVLTAIIEMQTMKRVARSPIIPRRPTRTDAAMATEVIDAALIALATELVHAEDLRWTSGFRYSAPLADPGAMELLLEDAAYRMLDCEVTAAQGARRGRVMLALPAEGRGPRPTPRRGAPEAEIIAARHWTSALRETVLQVEAPLEGVVGRVRLTLDEVLAMKIDDVLPLEMANLDQIALEAAGGRPVALCRLGQNRGMRAVRLAVVDPQETARMLFPRADPPALPRNRLPRGGGTG
ncbi:MAG: FliM/FliN family flagellar motor switch protein [Gemmobacter sp.]|jgi:flagellar motor switch protein FliM